MIEFNGETKKKLERFQEIFDRASKNSSGISNLVQNLTKVVDLEHEATSVIFEEIDTKYNQSLSVLKTKFQGTF